MDTSGIFNRISGSYNALNHIFSFGIDRLWRREAVSFLKRNLHAGAEILDEACGTGDLTLAEAKSGFEVTGIDISVNMLEIARKRAVRLHKPGCCTKRRAVRIPELMTGDAAMLPFSDNSFDAVTIAYGIRNFDDRPAALEEIMRVLRPGGVLLILEFAEPTNALLRFCYRLYFRHIVVFLAKLLTLGKERGAFSYFVQSVDKFPKFEKFVGEIESAGFADADFRKQSGGISVMYTARKPKYEMTA